MDYQEIYDALDLGAERRPSMHRCVICGCRIMDGDEYFDFDGEAVCELHDIDYVQSHRRTAFADDWG